MDFTDFLEWTAGLQAGLIGDDVTWLSEAAHQYIVLTKIGFAVTGPNGPRIRAVLLNHWEHVSDSIASKIAIDAEREGVPGHIKRFRIQKWYSAGRASFEQLASTMQSAGYQMSKKLIYQLRVNILEAAAVDQVSAIQDNVALALALAAAADTNIPVAASEASGTRVYWALDANWIDTYNTWNLNYVSQFGRLRWYIPKLLVPSVLCSRLGVHSTQPSHWPEPDPNQWFPARSMTLKASMAYIATRAVPINHDYASGNPGYDSQFTPEARNAWAKLSFRHSPLPRPHSCCGKGSLSDLWKSVLPYSSSFTALTSELDDEGFLVYSSLVVWGIVLITGFGSELVVGMSFVGRIGSREDLETFWRFVQLMFSLFLTVAFFSQSVFGLPLLVLGLWCGSCMRLHTQTCMCMNICACRKCGFPETIGALLRAFELGHAGGLTSVSLFLDGMGLIIHHSATSLIICCITTHLFPLSRPLLAACIVPVVQHCFVLIKYRSSIAYLMVQTALEVAFELEILANIDDFKTPYGRGVDRFGRACALAMLLSHWMYILSAMCHLASDALGSLSKSHLASLSRRLSEGVHVHHPIRGNGIITGELARDGKPYGVKFDNGEGHAYSVASAAKRLTPIGHSVQDRP